MQPAARPAVELRSLDEVAAWLAAGLALRRLTAPPSSDAEIAAATLACATELARLPPAGVIADVTLLLGGARPGSARPALADDALRLALRAYDDDVVARLVTTPRFDDVLAAYAHLAPALRPHAVALVVAALVERTAFVGTAVSTGTLRRALARGRDPQATTIGPAPTGDLAAALADEYLRLARGARQSRALVEARDVFAIDHLEVLGSFGRRLEAQHIAAAAEAFTAALPRRLPTRRDRRGTADTNLANDDSYPAGGFSAITPGGDSANLENLVPSELAYMEDAGSGLDLFTLRYVEGELLFYTRDDSVLRRERHTITFVLAPELVEARIKDGGLPWQRLVIVLGAVVAAVRWLVDQLAEQALALVIVFPPRVLTAERELVTLLLAGELESGVLAITESGPAAALVTAAAAPGAFRDALLLGGTPLEAPDDLRVLHVPLPAAAPWETWTDTLEDLLRWLL